MKRRKTHSKKLRSYNGCATVSLPEGGGFVLDTDASDTIIGTVLSQVQDGKERAVAYESLS